MHKPERSLAFPALLNVRDLGGHPTTDGGETRWRSLLRSDDLGQLTPAGVQALAEWGVKTVIDLRWAEEIALSPSPIAAQAPRIEYFHLSLLARTSTEWRRLSQNCAKEVWKCVVLERVRAELREVLRMIAEAPPGVLLFHCVAGKDRTGLIAALLLTLAQVEPASIVADYVASTAMLRDSYLKKYRDMEREDILEYVRCPEAGVHNMLAYLEGRGGVVAYLEEIGLTRDEIMRLKARLRD
jgi:protein-tyrosine phosphatase